ncbi:MAG: leucine-rich repeat domain-containing protein, partial [Tannerellaceae bacterium]|nr:leucine-rich repeat domain-containing protein [Tannerellaceae bacterium]
MESKVSKKTIESCRKGRALPLRSRLCRSLFLLLMCILSALPLAAQTTVSVTMSETVNLQQALSAAGVSDVATVTHLTITGGPLKATDFDYIRSNMIIQALDMSAADVQGNRIPSMAFYQDTGLIAVTLPETITAIGSYAFFGCSSLTQINIPDGVTTIEEGAFEGCTSLTTITIPASVTDMNLNVFIRCYNLTSFNVDDGNAKYYSVDGVLYDKIRNELYAYPGGRRGAFAIPDGVETIGSYAFYTCGNLSSITIPNSVTYIADNAFEKCFSLTSLTIPASVTTIVTGAFSDCSNLTSIDVDAGNTKYWSNDGALYEHGTYNVTETSLHTYPGGKSGVFTIPDDVTEIHGNAFSYNLTSLTIPASVTRIGNYAFEACSRLTDITVDWYVPLPINGYVFRGVNTAEISLYVPA